MTEPTHQTAPPPESSVDGPPLPPGDHPLEVAARAGIGPLSALSNKVWHGEATPCVSCGQLVRRNSTHCDSCGQDLSDSMIARMQKHAGPWYVLEHLRPFPGVTLERILLQVRRGLITPASIVRGPSTDHQWRFAVETPGICRLFGRCWNCYHGVKQTETYCPACLSHLGFEKPAPRTASLTTRSAPTPKTTATAAAAAPQPALSPPKSLPSIAHPNLDALAVAALQAGKSNRPTLDAPARVGPIRAGWIAVAAIVIVLTSLVWVTTLRSGETSHPAANQPTTSTIQTPATSN